jgi:transcriptional regulator with XRE-family HTH domain
METARERFAVTLKRHRDGHGLTLEGLAARVGVDKQTIWSYEQPDGQWPRWETFVKLAETLGISTLDFFAGPMPPDKMTPKEGAKVVYEFFKRQRTKTKKDSAP